MTYRNFDRIIIDMGKVCSFFGHADTVITDELRDKIKNEVLRLINDGFDVFLFGGFGNFDDECYKTVSTLRKSFPNIKRVFCLYDQRQENVYKRPLWLQKEEYEDYVYLSLRYEYWYKRIYYRNVEMINLSDFIIFYVFDIEKSGANKALKYAKQVKKKYVNII
mgnify:CR=1 FL=1